MYQAIIDAKQLETGWDYQDLKNVYIIMILPYDPFGKNRMVYNDSVNDAQPGDNDNNNGQSGTTEGTTESKPQTTESNETAEIQPGNPFIKDENGKEAGSL